IIDANAKVIDKLTTNFGIRSIEFSVDKGFLLNGKPTLLKGGCMHHGNGPLGAAAYDRAEERRVELMKASGFNSIRTAHNPPSSAFLDACDRLGILVIDETFDMWRQQKNEQDYHLYFDEWWKQDVDAMVKRDWNHPSVIMWSIGNEIPERGSPEGEEISKMLVDYIKAIDDTRPITAAVNGLGSDKDPYFATLDLAGYNYSFGGDHGQTSIFEKDLERVPGRISYCSESYPLVAFGAWMEVVDYPYVLGDYVWTGFDYLGEASIGWLGYPHDSNFYPWNHAFCGDIDICVNKRPQSYYRDVLWKNGNQLSIFVKPPVPSFPGEMQRVEWSKWHWQDVVAEWNWEGFEEEPLGVEVYCAFETVELFLNGKSLGKKETNRSNEWIAHWEVPYNAGELKAVAYSGTEVMATSVLKTADEPTEIQLIVDTSEIRANGQDLSYINVELVDKDGLVHSGTQNMINFEIVGPGEILAVASSNPMSVESFHLNKRKAWKGKCLVIVKSTKEDGKIKLIANSEGLRSASVLLHSKL
ncbi:MAG: glycoside hydrolase family 2 protein, partial [Mariniphaga sp.]|nr:glycoside hydrolase family 2 protein [Mariniphaga sp.]